MKNSEYLGIAAKVGHDAQLVSKYNALLEHIGTIGMLMQFERWADDVDIRAIISQTEDYLFENGIELPYNNLTK